MYIIECVTVRFAYKTRSEILVDLPLNAPSRKVCIAYHRIFTTQPIIDCSYLNIVSLGICYQYINSFKLLLDDIIGTANSLESCMLLVQKQLQQLIDDVE